MRMFPIFSLILLVYSCKGRPEIADHASKGISLRKKETLSNTSRPPLIQFSVSQKVRFLDSVANLDLQALKDSLTFDEDTTFQRRKDFFKMLSRIEFTYLKEACKKRTMNFETAKSIFPGFNDSTFIVGGDKSNIIIDHIPLSQKKQV